MPDLEWLEGDKESLRLRLNAQLYPPSVAFRTCYLFTDRVYIYLHAEKEDEIIIEFRSKRNHGDLSPLVGEFGNELISQRIRAELARETQHIRELIVTQAFSEADL